MTRRLAHQSGAVETRRFLRRSVPKPPKRSKILSKEAQIILFLEEIARARPDAVMSKLRLGSKVKKSLGASYVIGNDSLSLQVGPDNGRLHLGEISRHFTSNPKLERELFDSCSSDDSHLATLPFSQIFKEKVGGQLERAILLQILAQRLDFPSFLILSGRFSPTLGEATEILPFNMILREGKLFLLDLEHWTSEEPHIPYRREVALIDGLTGKIGLKTKDHRQYSIF